MDKPHRAPIVIVESPFKGEIERNKLYLLRCLRDCIQRGEIPFASHGFYPLFLDDTKEYERTIGIQAGYRFWILAQTVAFYTDYGMSRGMRGAEARAEALSVAHEYRKIGENL